MPDHDHQLAALEKAHIDVRELFELNVWARRFNVSQAHLKEAVQAVGTCARAVGDYLAHGRWGQPAGSPVRISRISV